MMGYKLYRRFVESPELDSGITESNYTDNLETSNNSPLVPESVKKKTCTKRRNTKKKRKKYSCPNPGCSKVFKMKGCLKTHSMYCGKPLRFMCPLCKYRSKWNCYVKSHISRVHSGENASVIDVYKPLDKSEGRYLCPNDECRKKCTSKRILENHINFECEKLTQFKCYYCSFRAHFRDDVKEHSMNEHKDKVYFWWTVGELPPAAVPASGELLVAPGQHEDDAKLPTIDDAPGVPRQETRVLLLPEVRQGIPVAQEHEEPPEGRVREGAHRVLSVLPPQDQIQAQPPEAHPQNSFLIIIKATCSGVTIVEDLLHGSQVCVFTKKWPVESRRIFTARCALTNLILRTPGYFLSSSPGSTCVLTADRCTPGPRTSGSTSKWAVASSTTLTILAVTAPTNPESPPVSSSISSLCTTSIFHIFPSIDPGSLALQYMCMVCKRRYRSKKSLDKHVTYECGGRKYFNCHLCNQNFSQKHSLLRHVNKMHIIENI
ncbi:uncharacterized protein LOC141536383 [Cotesia typhae]|uniref:uncharacterized protein LOC141536383 n=1 Tax=Cotesia typhae TaxID=2053667 RepID=UPI003D687FAF